LTGDRREHQPGPSLDRAAIGRSMSGVLVRSWSARATPEGAESYRRHFEDEVQPRLRGVSGQLGALLLRRDHEHEAELVVLTFWESLDAMREFAGADTKTAVVAPEARAVLKDYDHEVRILEVLVDARP
jgi:heme-degrading monooxygenase HmoA